MTALALGALPIASRDVTLTPCDCVHYTPILLPLPLRHVFLSDAHETIYQLQNITHLSPPGLWSKAATYGFSVYRVLHVVRFKKVVFIHPIVINPTTASHHLG